MKKIALNLPLFWAVIIFILFINPQIIFAQRYYDVGWPMVAFYPDSISTRNMHPNLSKPFTSSDSILKFDPVTYTGKLHKETYGFFRGNLFFDDHTGTHIDAPNHYVYKDGDRKKLLSVGELTVDQLTGPLVFLDMSSRNDRNVYPEDIKAIIDQLQNGAWLVVNFDLAKHYGTESYSTKNTPGFPEETCQYLADLIDNKIINIAGIGSDNGSTDIVPNFKNPETSCHGLLLSKRNILLIEGMGSLLELTKEKGNCELIVAPLKIIGGSGSPARVFVRCE